MHCVSSSCLSAPLAFAYKLHRSFHFLQFSAVFPSSLSGPIRKVVFDEKKEAFYKFVLASGLYNVSGL